MASMPQPASGDPDYVWEIATMWPQQGYWAEHDYLELTDGDMLWFEFTNGSIHALTKPSTIHQLLLGFLHTKLAIYLAANPIGQLFFTGIRLKLSEGKIRMPDLAVLRNENRQLMNSRLIEGADLAVEAVSDTPEDRRRDYDTKLHDYAEAGISEYWIVDPQERKVQVHHLEGDAYVLHGEFTEGMQADSILLSGFEVDVTELFAVIKDLPE